MRTDTRTTTLADAGWFEMSRSGGWGVDHDSRPSPSELAEDAYLDRIDRERRQARDDAARARGEYVPSPAMRAQASCLSMSLVQRVVLGLDVDAYREGVLRVTPENRRAPQATAEEVMDALRDIYSQPGYAADIAVRDNAVWVKIERSPFGDPFLDADGLARDEPPF